LLSSASLIPPDKYLSCDVFLTFADAVALPNRARSQQQCTTRTKANNLGSQDAEDTLTPEPFGIRVEHFAVCLGQPTAYPSLHSGIFGGINTSATDTVCPLAS